MLGGEGEGAGRIGARVPEFTLHGRGPSPPG